MWWSLLTNTMGCGHSPEAPVHINAAWILCAKFFFCIFFFFLFFYLCFLNATVQHFVYITSTRQWRSLFFLFYSNTKLCHRCCDKNCCHTSVEDTETRRILLFTDPCLGWSLAFITLEGIICVTVTDVSSFNSDEWHLARDVQRMGKTCDLLFVSALTHSALDYQNDPV